MSHRKLAGKRSQENPSAFLACFSSAPVLLQGSPSPITPSKTPVPPHIFMLSQNLSPMHALIKLAFSVSSCLPLTGDVVVCEEEGLSGRPDPLGVLAPRVENIFRLLPPPQVALATAPIAHPSGQL